VIESRAVRVTRDHAVNDGESYSFSHLTINTSKQLPQRYSSQWFRTWKHDHWINLTHTNSFATALRRQVADYCSSHPGTWPYHTAFWQCTCSSVLLLRHHLPEAGTHQQVQMCPMRTCLSAPVRPPTSTAPVISAAVNVEGAVLDMGQHRPEFQVCET
jgi:hypothetical protein